MQVMGNSEVNIRTEWLWIFVRIHESGNEFSYTISHLNKINSCHLQLSFIVIKLTKQCSKVFLDTFREKPLHQSPRGRVFLFKTTLKTPLSTLCKLNNAI